MSKLNFWPFGGKPQVVNPDPEIVKSSILLMKETILNYVPTQTTSTLDNVVTYKVGTFCTLGDGKIIPDYTSGFTYFTCKTEEEAQKAYDFLVKNNGKSINTEVLKETVLPTK
jgi:hypothetical protein